MSFMQKQIVFGAWFRVETSGGTFFLPSDLFDSRKHPTAADCLQYVEGAYDENGIHDIERIEGFGARLSAPGYMDCTEWAVFETETEAAEYLEATYGGE